MGLVFIAKSNCVRLRKFLFILAVIIVFHLLSFGNSFQSNRSQHHSESSPALHESSAIPSTTAFNVRAVLESKTAATPAKYSYGLFHIDGTPKQVAESISEIFGSGNIATSFNNGFEDGNNSEIPNNWLLWQATKADFAQDATVAHSGKASVRISRSIPGGSSIPAFYLSPVKYILARQTYAASVWAKGLNATGNSHLSLVWFDANSKYISSSNSQDLKNGTNNWTKLSVEAKAPANAAFVEIHLASANNRGTVWFDDVTFD